ncbi:putative membrane protein [Flavobacterium sp. 7E]|uniref:TMEM175 family protein n=1 Tax=Flavobacterium sp. 7E TaxID=2735898 RepID=UPI00156D67C7|nr:TMEM175 family protein [Flavobacterium sp. 7E]NRS87822.1 putative membrane protein [Flavobacterium sp. 7E]
MNKNRIEAFSDGVLAIIITIMVLGLKTPIGNDLASLQTLLPSLTTYLLSFIYVGIYWNNHHHLLQATLVINGKVLWANLHFLFWLSLLPFATGYMGESHFEKLPTAFYGFILLMASVAWQILIHYLREIQSADSLLHLAYGNRIKVFSSMTLYSLGTAISFIFPILAVCIYILVAILWIIPERKLEN